MSGLWAEEDGRWQLLRPDAYINEDELHGLVEDAPHTLPLSGAPSVAIAGREVRLGNGYADLVGIESTGRPVIIEVKLRANSEARRAVVAQVLTYAAYLHGLDVAELEQNVLGPHLAKRGASTLLDLARATDQAGAVDPRSFGETLDESLATGRFRLVIVLDAAPAELMELVAYLEVVAERLTVDLITVDRYVVDGTPILVPRRAEPERRDADPTPGSVKAREGFLVAGHQDFETKMAEAADEDRPLIARLLGWAKSLESEGLVSLSTYHGKQERRFTLLPRLVSDDAGLVTVWNDNGKGFLQFWRSVFVRRAPRTLAILDERYGDAMVGQGNVCSVELDGALLDLLTAAYREAVRSIKGS
jgi:hypothetical protein